MHGGLGALEKSELCRQTQIQEQSGIFPMPRGYMVFRRSTQSQLHDVQLSREIKRLCISTIPTSVHLQLRDFPTDLRLIRCWLCCRQPGVHWRSGQQCIYLTLSTCRSLSCLLWRLHHHSTNCISRSQEQDYQSHTSCDASIVDSVSSAR